MSDIKNVNIRGLLDVYEFPYTLPGSGEELLIKPITTGQMKKILAYEDENDPYVVEDALDRLMSDCVINKDFNINQLYLQDRFALMLEIRKVTKGSVYQFTYKCHKCGLYNSGVVDLSELPIKTFNRDNNIITISEKLKFEVDFPTREDQKIAVKKTIGKNLGYHEKMVDVQTGTFANAIKKVHTPDGILEEVPFEDKVYILDNISSTVFQEFSNWFKEHDFGVDFNSNVKCTGCGHEEKIDIPLSDFFV